MSQFGYANATMINAEIGGKVRRGGLERMKRDRLKFGGGMFCVGLAAAAAVAPVARADDRNSAAVVEDLLRCRRLQEPSERLACFDQTANLLNEAKTGGDIAIFDRRKIGQVQRQAFGFNLPSIAIFSSGGPAIDRVMLDIREAFRSSQDKWVMITSDGAEWRQTDDEAVLIAPRAGSKLGVRKAALGSFFCNIDGQRAVRCSRSR